MIQGPLKAEELDTRVKAVLDGVALDSGRAAAAAYAVGAAKSLARIDLATYNVAAASAPLAVAARRKGKVAVYSLNALGRAGSFDVVPQVLTVLNENLDSADIAIAAAGALGGMMERHGQAPDEVVDALMNIAAKGDKKVRAAATAALGRAPLTAAKRVEIMQKLRVDPGE